MQARIGSVRLTLNIVIGFESCWSMQQVTAGALPPNAHRFCVRALSALPAGLARVAANQRAGDDACHRTHESVSILCSALVGVLLAFETLSVWV
jgi:hypothetical protein